MNLTKGHVACFFFGLAGGVLLVIAATALRASIAQNGYDKVMENGGEVSYLHRGPALLQERMMFKHPEHDHRNLWYLDGWMHKKDSPWFSVEYDVKLDAEASKAVRFTLFSRNPSYPGLLVNWKATAETNKSHITITILDRTTNKLKASYVDVDMDGLWDSKIEGAGELFFVWFEETWHPAEINSEGELSAVLKNPDTRALRFSEGKWITTVQ